MPGTPPPDRRPDWPGGPAVRRRGARLLADVRAGRGFLAAELRQSSWLDFGAFRWHDLAPGRAARSALGVITPRAIGVATGHTEFGTYAALGALPAGFVAFRGVTRTRVLAVLLAAAGMAISTFVGATAALGAPWVLVPIIFGWAYATGLLAALGPTALAVSLQWPIALLIASAIPLDPAAAAGRALLVLAGGAFQGVLVVSSWAVARGSAERGALAGSFRALGAYAGDLRGGSQEPPSADTWAARTTMRDPNPLIRSDALLQLVDLADEAERIRRSLTALGAGRAASGPRPAGRSLLSAAQLVLTEVAAALTARPALRPGHLEAARRELAQASAERGTRWQWAGEALLGQLRAAVRITERLNAAEPARAGPGPPSGPRLASVQDITLTLRASVSTSSEAGRHALRLAVVTALAEIIVRAAGLPHGYWGVLTIFIVLRPDYSSTLYRGLQRAAGTVAGAGLGVLTVQLVHISDSALLAGIGVSLLAAYAVFAVNFLVYAVFLTDFVVVLLALLGLPPEPTAIDRLIGTGVGTGLALLAYVLWPTWEGTSASEKFARLFGAQGRYAGALLRAYTRPGDTGAGRRSELQLAARRARTDADASADRLAGEPEHPPMTAELARSLTAAARRISQASITLAAAVTAHHATRPDDAGTELQQRLDQLADDVTAATGVLALALRELGDTGGADGAPDPAAPKLTIPPLPPLRARQQEVWLPPQAEGPAAGPAAGAGSAPPSQGEAAGLTAATDGLVDAINTAAHVLREHR
jgi:uncharacterized membrane protein YccC